MKKLMLVMLLIGLTACAAMDEFVSVVASPDFQFHNQGQQQSIAQQIS